jgi:hypothetical protein
LENLKGDYTIILKQIVRDMVYTKQFDCTVPGSHPVMVFEISMLNFWVVVVVVVIMLSNDRKVVNTKFQRK